MSNIFDPFNGTGSLGALSYWNIGTGAQFTLGNGVADVDGSLSTDNRAKIVTNPMWDSSSGTVEVQAEFLADNGVERAGVLAFESTDADTEVGLRGDWECDTAGNQSVRLYNAGTSIATVGIPAGNFYEVTLDGVTPNLIGLRAIFQNLDGAGDPVYLVQVIVNGFVFLTAMAVTLAGYSSSNVYVGMFGRRETFGVPTPVLQFTEIMGLGPQRDVTHEPAPTITADATRTPITPADESPQGSPSTFPFEVRNVRVLSTRQVNRMTSEMGYVTTHPRYTASRRVFECQWVGTKADDATLQAFFEARYGSYENFSITIRAQGIGSTSVCFASPLSEPTKRAPNVYARSFALLELLT